MKPTNNAQIFIINDSKIKELTPGDIIICLELELDGDLIINNKNYKILEKHIISRF